MRLKLKDYLALTPEQKFWHVQRYWSRIEAFGNSRYYKLTFGDPEKARELGEQELNILEYLGEIGAPLYYVPKSWFETENWAKLPPPKVKTK